MIKRGNLPYVSFYVILPHVWKGLISQPQHSICDQCEQIGTQKLSFWDVMEWISAMPSAQLADCDLCVFNEAHHRSNARFTNTASSTYYHTIIWKALDPGACKSGHLTAPCNYPFQEEHAPSEASHQMETLAWRAMWETNTWESQRACIDSVLPFNFNQTPWILLQWLPWCGL